MLAENLPTYTSQGDAYIHLIPTSLDGTPASVSACGDYYVSREGNTVVETPLEEVTCWNCKLSNFYLLEDAKQQAREERQTLARREQTT